MKSIIVSMFAAVGLMVAGSAMATDIPEAQQKIMKEAGLMCATCHKVGSKLVGPAWKKVSDFYNGKTKETKKGKTLAQATGGKTPEAWLIHKVSEGGKGNWGSIPMSANDRGGKNAKKQAGIKAMVEYVLSISK